YDNFIYIDIDTVVNHSFDCIFDFLKDYDLLTATSNFDPIRGWVWRNTIDTVATKGLLTWAQKAYAANTGFIAAKKESFSLDFFMGKALEAIKLIPHMELHCIEQPFLNYAFVTSSKKISSLRVLRCESGDETIPIERWAGEKFAIVEGGKIRFPQESGTWFYENPVLFVHWAGLWQEHFEKL